MFVVHFLLVGWWVTNLGMEGDHPWQLLPDVSFVS